MIQQLHGIKFLVSFLYARTLETAEHVFIYHGLNKTVIIHTVAELDVLIWEGDLLLPYYLSSFYFEVRGVSV